MKAACAAALALALAVVLASPAAAFYEKNSAVVTLTPDNFKDEVLDSAHLWIVEFYAPWCGHCQRLKPDYEKAATNLKGLVKLGAVDCDAEQNKPLCGQYGIQGFPTIKVFPSQPAPNKKEKKPTDYQGERTARAIVEFATSQLTSFVKKISTKESKQSLTLEAFLAEAGKLAHVILFTSKTSTTPLFKALSAEFKDRLLLGEVQATDAAIVSKYNVDKFPTIVVIPKEEGSEPIVYTGALKSDDLIAYLDTYALPAPPKKSSSSGSSGSAKKAEPFDPVVPQVKTQADFEKHCTSKSGTCVITFAYVDPEFEETVTAHNENLKVLSNLKKKAYDSKQAINFLWVDAIKQQALRESFGVSDMFPSVLAISPSRNVFRPFVGGFEEPSLDEFLKSYQSGKGGRSFKYTHEIQIKE